MRFCPYFLVPVLFLFCAMQNTLAATNGVIEADGIQAPPIAPGIVFPVTVTTNAAGVPVHQFSMTPAITNMVAATNDLAVLKVQLEAIEAESKKVSEVGGEARNKMRNGYRDLVGAMTNFPTRNPEAKKMHDRITTLESEMKELKAEYQKKMDEDEAYKLAKSKIEADQETFKNYEEKATELRKKRMDIRAKVLQLQTMVDRTLIKEEQDRANEAKAKKDKSAVRP